MDHLPAHFRRDPSQWRDIHNFMNKRPKNDAKARYKAFRGFLQSIHDASEAGDIEKAAALELLGTTTLSDFQVESHLMKKQAAIRVAEHAKEKVRENSFASAAALIIHAEDELVKDITKRRLLTSPQEKGVVRKRVRTEVSEVSSFFSEPWGSLMKVMHDLVRYGQSETPIPSGDNLSVPCKALYTYICAHLEDGKVVLQNEKDLLVAMSGVINLRAANTKDIFGMRLINDIEASGPKAQPDVNINNTLQSLSEILNKNSVYYLRDEISILDAERIGRMRRGEYTDPLQKVVLDVVRFLADKIIAGTFGNTEHAVVSTWKSVLDFISEGLLKLESGELTSDATKEIRILQEQEFSGTSKGVCGRKMDLHLHLNGLELNNSEFKAVGVDIEENKRQSRRNIRVNKAIMVYLQRHAKFDFQKDDYLIFLDVSGYTGAIIYLRRYEDIHVSGLLSRVAIKLPIDEKGLKMFLCGQSLGWLFTYEQRLRSMQQEVEDAQTQALDESFLLQERTTPPLQPRELDVIVMNSPKKPVAQKYNSLIN